MVLFGFETVFTKTSACLRPSFKPLYVVVVVKKTGPVVVVPPSGTVVVVNPSGSVCVFVVVVLVSAVTVCHVVVSTYITSNESETAFPKDSSFTYTVYLPYLHPM